MNNKEIRQLIERLEDICCCQCKESEEESLEAARTLSLLLAVYEPARGMTYGTDWNKGTAAHHHRKNLVAAVKRVEDA